MATNITNAYTRLDRAMTNRHLENATQAATQILQHYRVNSNNINAFTKISHALRIRELRNKNGGQNLVNNPTILKEVLRR